MGMIVDLMLLSCQSLPGHQEGNLQARDHIGVSFQAMEGLFTERIEKDQASDRWHALFS